MKSDSALGRSCKFSLFNRQFTLVIDHILAKAQVKVACLKEDEDVILGYIIFEEPNILHYVFIKEAFRRLDVAKNLIQHALTDQDTIEFSLKTNTGRKVLTHSQTRLKFIYNPFLLMLKGALHG